VWLEGRYLVELTTPALQAWQLGVKRLMDLVGALLALALLSPLLVGIAVAIRLDSPGPILFSQMRLGAHGRRFRCYKFRSMRRDAEALLRDPALYDEYVRNHFKMPEDRDPRITRVGRWLRRTSLDELPQLVNVLWGDMSLVGPRPIVPAEIRHFGAGASLLLSLKPGMTGAWAVSGRSQVGYPDRALLELAYIRTWSIVRDVGILLRTVPTVLRRRGAH
jgi:lipopolysaccharide/colanic/teichoic acid biosynthesis glycosyltransferase